MTRSEFDFERLSAALDGRLNTEEQANLDADLTVDKALRSDWEELQSTVQLLKGLPAIQPPRSFTLDPAVYAKPQRGWIFAWTRWAAVLGAVVLIAVVGTAWLNNSGSQSAAPMAADPASNDNLALDSSSRESAMGSPYIGPAAGSANSQQYQYSPSTTVVMATPAPTELAAVVPAPTKAAQPNLAPTQQPTTRPQVTASPNLPATQAPPAPPEPTLVQATVQAGTDSYPLLAPTETAAAEPTAEIVIAGTVETTTGAGMAELPRDFQYLKANPISPYTDPVQTERFTRLVWFGYDLINAGLLTFNQQRP